MVNFNTESPKLFAYVLYIDILNVQGTCVIYFCPNQLQDKCVVPLT